MRPCDDTGPRVVKAGCATGPVVLEESCARFRIGKEPESVELVVAGRVGEVF